MVWATGVIRYFCCFLYNKMINILFKAKKKYQISMKVLFQLFPFNSTVKWLHCYWIQIILILHLEVFSFHYGFCVVIKLNQGQFDILADINYYLILKGGWRVLFTLTRVALSMLFGRRVWRCSMAKLLLSQRHLKLQSIHSILK